MRNGMGGLLLLVSCGAVLASGCAKHEMVKKDEGIAQVAAPVAAPVKQEAPKAVAKPQSVEQKVVEQPVAPAASDAQRQARELAALQNDLQKIYFNFDSANLSEQARNNLVKNADLLRKSEKAKVRIEGNCDERGSDDYNLALGEKRAKEAKQYLVGLGISGDRLSTVSYGKEKPVAAGHDEASWAKNRRDEFVILR
ncbi:peptidoglycan-associated lipoprotein Pal [Geomonas sp.]|uniref:peptidoglycan-associated lipoprotein Pal n=1 Tax=Geomonas sp. TaxID=2651584 RepID=UPI002B483CC4|nr:peptidoglycan-associated lipoprotein Pal [Geomonas sp.]HJV34040.1 peptidoglycan-associated lipoprotein Pal [Geomonas sp.]